MKFFYIIIFTVIVLSAGSSFADDVIYSAKKESERAQKIVEDKVRSAAAIVKNSKPKEVLIDYNDIDNNTAVDAQSTSQITAGSLEEAPEVKTDCDFDGRICVYFYVYQDRVLVEAENKTPAARTIIMDYSLNNMRTANNSSRRNIILKANERKKIEMLHVADKRFSYGYNYNYQSYFGVIDAVHDDSYVYDLPFDNGQKYLLYQGIGGNFSHKDEANYYAYDFKMPNGTPVLAARDGIVVKVVNNFTQGGLDPRLKNRANFIYIQHSDGTIGNYNHLKHKSAMVSVGDNVQKNQKIALSGDTGYTTNPHLHFSVFKVVRRGKFKSVAIKIKTKQGVLEQLKAQEYYEK